MASGFQVFNDSNILQIDEFYKNMVLVNRSNVSLQRPSGVGSQPYPQAAYARLNYPVSSRSPILAIRSPVNVCFLTDDNGFTIFGSSNSIGAIIELFIYDNIAYGNGGGNTGLQVFDANGAEVFNTNNNYMRVYGSYSLDVGPVNPTNGVAPPTYSGSIPAGRQVAVCMGVQSTGYYIEGIGTPQQPAASIRYWHCQVQTSSNNFTLTNGVITQFAGPIPATPGLQGAITSYNSGLLIDVTGTI